MAVVTRQKRRRLPGYCPVDPDYWLCRCEGFRVDTSEGKRGVVEEVRFGTRLDRPDWIAIRGGLFSRQLEVVPVDGVAAIYPREGLILLSV